MLALGKRKLTTGGATLRIKSLLFLLLPLVGLTAQEGDVDSTFGTFGIVKTSLGASSDVIQSLAIQPDGKIVAAGHSYNVYADFAVVRYNSDGTLDTSFNSDGKVTTQIGTHAVSHDFGRSVALQVDGKIVLAGRAAMSGTDYDFAVVRYNSDGSLDANFGGDGIVITPIAPGNGFDQGEAVAIQTDGKIVVAGYSYLGSGSGDDFVLVRYESDGSLDSTFGTDGIVITDINGAGNSDEAYAIAIQPDGKIVVVGETKTDSRQFAVVRYSSDGSLDAGFGNSGVVTTSIGLKANIARSVTIQSDGKIVVAGVSSDGRTGDGESGIIGEDFSAAPYNSDGGVESSESASTGKDFSVARYNSDGSLDTSFSTDGMLKTPLGTNAEYGEAVAVQGDGKIVVVGYDYKADKIAVVRYNSDGSLDTNFSDDGIIITTATTDGSQAHAVAILPDGNILVAGGGDDLVGNTSTDFILVRYIGDATGPTVNSFASLTSPTNVSAITVTVEFGEPVEGFIDTDVTLGNASLSNFTGSGGTYEFDVIPTYDGIVTVDIGANVVVDWAGNGNSAAPQISFTSDRTAPIISMTSSADSITTLQIIPIIATFSESVTGFEASDVTVENGSLLSNSFDGSGDSYSFTVIASSFGAVTVDIEANAAQDEATNGNTAGQFSIIVIPVNVAPTVTSAATASATEDVAFAYLITGNDGNGDALTVGTNSPPAWLTLDVDTLRGTPLEGDRDTTFQIWVVDASTDTAFQSLTITVTAVNDAPTITSSATAAATEDIAFAYVITGTDVEGDALTVGAYNPPAWLTLDVDTLKGTPMEGDSDTTFQIWVVDASTDSAFQNLAITVTGVNDAPVLASNNGITVDEGGLASITSAFLAATDVDNTAAQLHYHLEPQPSPLHGKFIVADTAMGEFFTQADLDSAWVVFEHDGSEANLDSVGFFVRDPDGAELHIPYFAIHITPVNDAPGPVMALSPAVGETIVIEDSTLTFEWSQAHDPDSDSLKYVFYLTGPGVHAVVEVGLDTTLSVRVDAYAFVPDSLYEWQIGVTDGLLITDSDIFEFSLPTSLRIGEPEQIPVAFALHQNFPNPFNPTSTIRFDLPEATDLDLVVYDLRGRFIASLNSGAVPAGFHQVVWNGRDRAGRAVPSGMYIARLRTPEFTKSIKMVLLK